LATETVPEDYRELLWAIRDTGRECFVLGGQAVNRWALEFIEQEPSLSRLMPFTSKDCDVWIDPGWKQVTKMVEGEWAISENPVDGQLAILTTPDGSLKIDLLQNAFGIDEDGRTLWRRSLDIGGDEILFMEPIDLFRSKCACLATIPQVERQDEKHVRILALVLPRYIEWLVGAQDWEDEGRLVLRQVKRLREACSSKEAKKSLKAIGAEADELVPISCLRESLLPKLKRYAESVWPKD